MLYTDLVEHYNSVCEKYKKAIKRANDEIAYRGCLEIEIAGLKQELKNAYREIAELKCKN